LGALSFVGRVPGYCWRGEEKRAAIEKLETTSLRGTGGPYFRQSGGMIKFGIKILDPGLLKKLVSSPPLSKGEERKRGRLKERGRTNGHC